MPKYTRRLELYIRAFNICFVVLLWLVRPFLFGGVFSGKLKPSITGTRYYKFLGEPRPHSPLAPRHDKNRKLLARSTTYLK